MVTMVATDVVLVVLFTTTGRAMGCVSINVDGDVGGFFNLESLAPIVVVCEVALLLFVCCCTICFSVFLFVFRRQNVTKRDGPFANRDVDR